MKTEATMKKYFKKRADAIDFFLEKPFQSFTAENFHKLP